jgi:YesN/AraC family two-component response regulator
MKPGDLVIIPPGQLHKSSYDEAEKPKKERVVLRFGRDDLDWCRQMLSQDVFNENLECDLIHVPDKRREYILGLFQRLIYESYEPDELSPGTIKSLIQEVVLFTIRCRKYGMDCRQKVDDVNSSVIQDVATYIYTNYNKPIYLDEVADRFGISRSYLSKKFKNLTGFGFKEYLLNVRIKEACRLLLETNKSITEVACLCGFNDSNYFGDAFRRIKGISPNKYRHSKDAI